jgi:tRNA A37 threonylcarbamoyladenosine dehydratase
MFERTLRIIDKETLIKIQQANVLLVGVGGVGGFVLEALVRLGFLNITIIDNDVIEESNLNRQIISNIESIGLEKTNVAKKRALSINKDINIKEMDIFLTKDNFNNYINEDYDYIIDACDDIDIKIELIKYAQKKNIKIITCLGTGRKLNPKNLEITTLNKTYNDPLAKKLRHVLRKNNISLNTKVLFSKEEAIKTIGMVGSAMFVPASAGILLANYVFMDIIKETE